MRHQVKFLKCASADVHSLKNWGRLAADTSSDGVDLMHQPPAESELTALRHRVNRGTPVGDQRWIESTSKQLGLNSTLRPRPKKENEE